MHVLYLWNVSNQRQVPRVHCFVEPGECNLPLQDNGRSPTAPIANGCHTGLAIVAVQHVQKAHYDGCP